MARAPEKASAPPVPPPASEPGDGSPGLPFFRTWRGVYWFVAACFVAYVIVLAALPRIFA